jgi:GT2 family glycosyltransferase
MDTTNNKEINDCAAAHDRPPLLSIVIANWNACDLLEGCLRSLKEHAPTKYDMEVIVMDDASTDGSADMVRREFPEVRLLETQTKWGFTRINNWGLREAKGDLLLSMNPDMVVHPGALERLCDLVLSRPDLGIISAQLLNDDGTLQLHHYPFPTLSNVFYFTLRRYRRMRTRLAVQDESAPDPCDDPACPHTLIYTEALAGACQLVRREVLEKIGYGDEQFPIWLGDFDWCQTASARGYRMAVLSCAKITHFHSASTSRGESAGDFRTRDYHLFYSWQLYFRKHFGVVAAQEIRLVLLTCVLLQIGVALAMAPLPRRRSLARRRLAKYRDALMVLFRGPESVGIEEWRTLERIRAGAAGGSAARAGAGPEKT